MGQLLAYSARCFPLESLLMSWLDVIARGLTQGSISTLFVYGFCVTFFTVLCVTLYLHRCQSHRAVDIHPIVAQPMRLWLWLSTAMLTKEWVAIHRKHHAHCETENDPHSPATFGIKKVLLDGVRLYRDARRDQEMVEKFGIGTPNDWVERKIYTPNPLLGIRLMLMLNMILFGAAGLTIWALQMIWIPFFAAGVINGLGHWWGYRNFATKDLSTNIVPIGFFLGGEELHNNHHAFASSAKFSLRKYEFDIGWVVLRVLSFFKLATILRVAPSLAIRPNIDIPDKETMRAILVQRCNVMGNYFREVTLPAIKHDLQQRNLTIRSLPKRLRRALADGGAWLEQSQQLSFNHWIAKHQMAQTLMQFRVRLDELMESRSLDLNARLDALRLWCKDAEASGIFALQQFAQRLRGYALAAE